jgi:hypothetical protein
VAARTAVTPHGAGWVLSLLMSADVLMHSGVGEIKGYRPIASDALHCDADLQLAIGATPASCLPRITQRTRSTL